jgi:hypothetical protein
MIPYHIESVFETSHSNFSADTGGPRRETGFPNSLLVVRK